MKKNGSLFISLYLAPEINSTKKLEKALQRARIDWKKADREGYEDVMYCLKEAWKNINGENVSFVFTMLDALNEIPNEYLFDNGIAFATETIETIQLDATKSA